MLTGNNPLLEARLLSLRESLDALAAVVDENLRAVLRKLTCDEHVNNDTPLRPVNDLAKQSRECCLLLVARQQPIASDLKYAMGVLRVGHDYERIQELAESLNTRVQRLRGTPMQEIIRDMTGVMADILKLHDVIRSIWTRDRDSLCVPNLHPQVEAITTSISAGVAKIQSETIAAISSGRGTAETLVELVVACRHIKRISNTMQAIPEELHSFDPA